MIYISDNVKTAYLEDSVNKNLHLKSDIPTLEEVNYYLGSVRGNPTDLVTMIDETGGSGSTGALWIPLEPDPLVTRWDDYVEWDYLHAHTHFAFAFYLQITGTFSVYSGSWVLVYEKTDATAGYITLKESDTLSLYNNPKKLEFNVAIPSDMVLVRGLRFTFTSTSTYSNDIIRMSRIQVNFVDHADYIPKYYEPSDFAHFNPYKQGWDINNDELFYDAFSLTESLCSQDNIKLGLCEAAHCEFETVDTGVEVGDRFSASITLPDFIPAPLSDADLYAINWSELDTTNALSMSYANRDFNSFPDVVLTPYKCGNWSHYVTKLSLSTQKVVIAAKTRITISNLTGTAPSYYKVGILVNREGSTSYLSGNTFIPVDNNFADVKESFNFAQTNYDITNVYRLYVLFYDANKSSMTYGAGRGDILIEAKEYQVRLTNDDTRTIPEYSLGDEFVYNGTLDEYIGTRMENPEIPLGWFTVSQVSKEYNHNLVKRKVVAYDALTLLENNAADWYTRYMFGVDFDSYTDSGFQFARQIFSSYWSYVSSIGLDSLDNYDQILVESFARNAFQCYSGSCYGYVSWELSVGNRYYRAYAKKEVDITEPNLLYRVTYDNMLGLSDEKIMELYNAYYVESGKDTMLRGFGTIGGVLIEEYRAGESAPSNRICVNRGDFFMLMPDTVKIGIVIPGGSTNQLSASLAQNVKLYSATPRQDLVNGYLRLCYYNYGTKEIFACQTSITGRDVVRSLLEVCGCFFRLSREDGLPEYVYPTKGGLYPHNTLLPSDELYPRAGTDGLYPMGRYMKCTAENYEVKDFGRIQILKDAKTNNTVSVCEWEYVGSDAENTYIIDDNIFYCADDMMYDYDNMPEVAQMLAGMWGVISNLGYVPNITEAIGSPWIECGDRLGLLTYDGGFETFIFRRTLKGIQFLVDTYESVGDEKNDAIDNFGY